MRRAGNSMRICSRVIAFCTSKRSCVEQIKNRQRGKIGPLAVKANRALLPSGKMWHEKFFRPDARSQVAADAAPVVTDFWKTNRVPSAAAVLHRWQIGQPADSGHAWRVRKSLSGQQFSANSALIAAREPNVSHPARRCSLSPAG